MRLKLHYILLHEIKLAKSYEISETYFLSYIFLALNYKLFISAYENSAVELFTKMKITVCLLNTFL